MYKIDTVTPTPLVQKDAAAAKPAKGACTCAVCVRHNAMLKHMETMTEAQKVFFMEMYEDLVQAENDAAHTSAILQGSWPNAEEILEACLERLRQPGAPRLQ